MLNISESVSRAMIDINVLAGLIACGENGAIVHCNQEAAVFCGYGVDEMRQLNLLDIFHSSTNNQGLSQFHNILEDKFGSYSIEVEASRKDRVVTKAAISGMRCTWNNQPADLIYLQDYNGYKSLKEFVRIQSTMLESITDPIVVINTGGSIVYLNAANCRLTGYTREEILGHNSFEIFHPEFHEQWLAIVQMQLSRDKYSGPVLPIKNKDGLLINVMGHTSPLFDEKGQIIGRICFTVKSQEENPLANRSSETLILISEPNSSPPNPGTQEKPAGQEGSFVFLPQLHIKCLGGLEVRSAKQEIHYLNSCRGREVLEFMLTRYQGPVRRDKLIEALWPEFTPAAASNNLKVAVHHLRTELNQILGYDKHFPSIFFSNGCYALDVRIVLSIDVAEFENHWARGRFLESQGQRESAILEFTKAEALYRGDFLDNEHYKEWLQPRREALKDSYLSILNRLIDYNMQDSRFDEAVNYCQKILAKEPGREDTYRKILTCYSRLGQRSRAIQWYETCCRNLKSEIDSEPEKETLALYSRIKIGEQV